MVDVSLGAGFPAGADEPVSGDWKKEHKDVVLEQLWRAPLDLRSSAIGRRYLWASRSRQSDLPASASATGWLKSSPVLGRNLVLYSGRGT